MFLAEEKRFAARAAGVLMLAAVIVFAAGTGPAEGAGRDHAPVYRVPLRVHLEESGRSADAFLPILEEINGIWLSQAGICFEMAIVTAGPFVQEGIDLWFLPELEEGEEMNGVYRDDHDIRVRDTPNLSPADHPAGHPAARTAAHELGHSLGLAHRQDRDDNLMRSKTYGWQLSEEEVRLARSAAKGRALPDAARKQCGITGP